MVDRGSPGHTSRMSTMITFETRVADHDPALYTSHGEFSPVDGLAAIGDDAVEQYDRDGFLVVRNAFAVERIQEALAELRAMSEAVDPDCAQVAYEAAMRTRIDETLGPDADVADLDLRDRDEVTRILAQIDRQERARMVRKFMGFTKTHPPLGAIANDKPMRAAIERLVGEPTKLFQTMALVKPPGGREKPWHQDHAYFDLPLDAKICGVWIALGHVTAQNGAMFMLRGAHRDGPIVHFKRRDWQICDTEVAGKSGVVAVPLKPGGLLFFDGLLPHGTPHNNSPKRRRALQFHYHNQSAEKWSAKERMAIFGSEGKDVQC